MLIDMILIDMIEIDMTRIDMIDIDSIKNESTKELKHHSTRTDTICIDMIRMVIENEKNVTNKLF